MSLAPQDSTGATYLSSQSDLTGKNILRDNAVLQNCTKLEITKTDVWNSTNRWQPSTTVMYVVESSDASYYQLAVRFDSMIVENVLLSFQEEVMIDMGG